MRFEGKFLLATIIGIVPLTNCAPVSKNGFTGNTANQENQDLPATEGCTHAKLIGVNTTGSAVIDQTANPRTLTAELILAPCTTPGAAPVILDTAFDLDSHWKTSGGGQPYDGMNIAYKITPDGQSTQTAYLSFKFGSDLFGKSGSDYFKLVTTDPVSIPATTSRASIAIDLSNVLIVPRDPNQVGTNIPIQIFLKVGDAAPITGTVTVTPPPPN